MIEPFAGYAFNKAHSVSYAMIAYWTAYLKANYPGEFMTALLSCHLGQSDKTASAVAECHRLSIPVLPPDVNRSALDFTIEQRDDDTQAIRFGLSAIKNVGCRGGQAYPGDPGGRWPLQIHRGPVPSCRPPQPQPEGPGEPYQGRSSGLTGQPGCATQRRREDSSHIPEGAGA